MTGFYVVAHPLTEAVSAQLPVSPAVVATIGACLVAGVARLAGPAAVADGISLTTGIRPWVVADPLPRTMWATRLLGVVGLVVIIGMARFAVADPNSSFWPVFSLPTIVVGMVFPLLVLAAMVLGDVWGWLDPWDTLARAITSDDPAVATDSAPPVAEAHHDAEEPGPPAQPAPDVRWAIPAALAWMWYIAAFRGATSDPRALGSAIALYSLATLGGCLLVGRRAWLTRGEPFGLYLSWVGRLRRARLTSWAPPKGAAAVLGIIAGGLIFAEVRTSSLWGVRDLLPYGALRAVGGLAASCAIAAAVLAGGERRARRFGAPGSVVAAAVPTTAGIALALSLTDNTLLSGVEATIRSFGVTWTGPPLALPAMPLLLTQIGLLFAGAVIGGLVAARRAPSPRSFGPAVIVTCTMMGAAVLLVTAA